ncbi:MAG TPA: hypothetical protein VF546_10755 [Pyrinomonadaceae bacterium]|jgi:hypothetical protein
MKDTERRIIEMLVRVREFCRMHVAAFAAGTRAGELFAELDDIVAELERHTEAQATHRSAGAQGTSNKEAARKALRALLEAISHTARAMDIDTPGLAARFRLPRGNNDQLLLSVARAFAAAAEPLKRDFIRYDLPADFLDKLNAQIEAFEKAIADQNRSNEARVAATQAINTVIERGLAVVRQLDAIVRNKFRADPATIAAWASASHVERAPRTKKQAPKPASVPAG